MTMISTRHPNYNASQMEKWRLTYEGGDAFITKYLKSFSSREKPADFATRKEVTYLPAFAKGAVDEVKNAIFQRTVDVVRKGGTASYDKAIAGLQGGVDLNSSSMNEFIGNEVLPELLPMKYVGVYIDNTDSPGSTMKDIGFKHPYIYTYKAEDILSWRRYQDGENLKFSHLLLRDNLYSEDENGLPNGTEHKYRFYTIIEDSKTKDKKVQVKFFDSEGEETSTAILNLNVIPFVLFELNNSIIADVCNHQIALLNLASSDLNTIKSNFPFYVEQFDPKVELAALLQKTVDKDGKPVDVTKKEIETGTSAGRRYPLGTNEPAFINPSAEPLKASMAKQSEIKIEIRSLVSLAVANLVSKMASEGSKAFDERGLEAGLSYIGLVLERGERQIQEIWAAYEKKKLKSPTLKYPEKYSLQSDKEKLSNAKDLKIVMGVVPSVTYKKEVAKEISRTTMGSKVSYETLQTIEKEIDAAAIIIVDQKDMIEDIEKGILSAESASKAKGYPEGEFTKAQAEHIKRLKEIAISQTEGAAKSLNGSRGIADLETGAKDGTNISSGELEKQEK